MTIVRLYSVLGNTKSYKITSKIEVTMVKSESAVGGGKRNTAK